MIKFLIGLSLFSSLFQKDVVKEPSYIQKEKIKNETEIVETSNLKEGEERLIKGRDGIRDLVYKDGKLLYEEIRQKPVNDRLEKGTRIEKTIERKFKSIKEENPKYREGKEVLKQKGKNSKIKEIYKKENGELKKLGEKVIDEGQDEIIYIGTKPEYSYEDVGDLNGDGFIDTLDLIEYHRDEIIAVARQTGIYPSIIAAQMIHESGREINGLAKNGRNYFGIKFFNGLSKYGAQPFSHPTFEIENGQRVNTTANFASFPDFKSSLNAFVDLYWNGLYDNTVKAEIYNLEGATVDSMLNAINLSPYSTDPSYSSKLIDCINVFGFYKYDPIAFPNGRLRASRLDGEEKYSIGEYEDDGLNIEDTTWKNPSNF